MAAGGRACGPGRRAGRLGLRARRAAARRRARPSPCSRSVPYPRRGRRALRRAGAGRPDCRTGGGASRRRRPLANCCLARLDGRHRRPRPDRRGARRPVRRPGSSEGAARPACAARCSWPLRQRCVSRGPWPATRWAEPTAGPGSCRSPRSIRRPSASGWAGSCARRCSCCAPMPTMTPPGCAPFPGWPRRRRRHRRHRPRPFARLCRHLRRCHRHIVRGHGPREDRPLRGAARDGSPESPRAAWPLRSGREVRGGPPQVPRPRLDPVRRRVEVEAGLAWSRSCSRHPSARRRRPSTPANSERRWTRSAAVFTPRWPRLSTPTLTELAAASDLAVQTRRAPPRSPRGPSSDITSQASSCSPWASSRRSSGTGAADGPGTGRCSPSCWPASSPTVVDPEGWQTGAVGFWEHLLSPEVVQHRIMLVLTALFGFAEWRVRSGRHPDSPWRYVFPVVAIWSGVLLLAHAHELGDSKLAFFMEISHLLLGLTACGGLGTLARTPAACCRERDTRPDVGPGPRCPWAAPDPVPRGMRAGRRSGSRQIRDRHGLYRLGRMEGARFPWTGGGLRARLGGASPAGCKGTEPQRA